MERREESGSQNNYLAHSVRFVRNSQYFDFVVPYLFIEVWLDFLQYECLQLRSLTELEK